MRCIRRIAFVGSAQAVLSVVALAAAHSLVHADEFSLSAPQSGAIVAQPRFAPPPPADAADLPSPILTSGPVVESAPNPQPAEAGPEPEARFLFDDRPLSQLRTSINLPAGEAPRNRAAELLVDGLFDGGSVRPWVMAGYAWEAPATRHLPLWFEEPELERLGIRDVDDHTQPFISGGKFVLNAAMIPYYCGKNPVCRPLYTLGERCPDSSYYSQEAILPLSPRGVLYEAAAITGVAFLIP